jgi:Tol biopolymer transport system component
MRFAIALPPGDQFSGAPQRQLVALSPDGATLVYAANDRLYLRRLVEDAAAPIRGTESKEGNAPARDPFFSPDGSWIGYTVGAHLWKVAVDGGNPVAIARITGLAFGPSWGADDRILYSSPDGIWQVAAGGGNPERVITARDGEMIHGPRLLPDGRTVLYTVGTGVDWNEADIVAEPLDGSDRTVLSREAATRGICRRVIWCTPAEARYSRSGSISPRGESPVARCPFWTGWARSAWASCARLARRSSLCRAPGPWHTYRRPP